ncbi:DNA polymerase, partial [Candidatus Woesearchaeota archaeon]|nr:DNA polymerase [Candidatus Woesearchaeota archaeon]
MVLVKFFPIDIDYEDAEELAIRIFGKTIDNKRICVFDYNFKPYFWVIPKEDSDFERLIRRIKEEREEDSFVLNAELEEKKFLGKIIKAVKVIVNKPKDVPILSRLIRDYEDVKSVNENDIQFVKRYLID